MPKFNPQEAARLQAIVDADPAIQAAYRAFQEAYFATGKDSGDVRKRAKKAVDAAINRNPELKRAKVAEGTIGEGYQWNRGRPTTTRQPGQAATDEQFRAEVMSSPLTIGREGSDWGHIVRDMILPAAGAGAIVAAPAIIGSQMTTQPSSSVSSALGGGTSAMTGAGTIAGPTTAQTIAGAGAAGGGGGGLGLGSILNPRTIGAGLGAISQGQAQNRGEEFGGQLDLARAQIEREQENRMGGLDAWRRLLMAQRTLSPGPRPQLSPYSVKPRQATADELSGANAMTREVMARLQGGPRELTVDPRLLKPGRGERFLGYAAPVLGGVGRAFGY